MAPIRVGLIGLGPKSSEGYTPGEWGVQHKNAILKSPHYELVAVCNSSVESAQKSITSHGLPDTVKAYGSPEEIASDPNVDLVVVAVNINKHYELTVPALKHKKNVLIEFPVAPTPAQTQELATLAKEAGVSTVIGSQARADPAFRKMKQLVEEKAIGDIVHTSFAGQLGLLVSQGWVQSQLGFLDLYAGISRVNIQGGHRKRTLPRIFDVDRVTKNACYQPSTPSFT